MSATSSVETSSRRVRKRTPVKSNAIVAELRRRIVVGRYKPGVRLPTHAVLRRAFKVSVNTVQRAMDQLAAEGFLVPVGASGTFVSERPPHLARYGILFRNVVHRPDRQLQGRDTFLLFEAMRLKQAGVIDLCIYEGFEGDLESLPYYELMQDIRASRLAGLVVATPWLLRASKEAVSLIKEHHLPVIGIAEPQWASGFPCVAARHKELVERALDDFAARGRRRVAVLGLSSAGDDSAPAEFNYLQAAVKARKMITHPYWLQTVGMFHLHAARNCMNLLMQARERPDALLIADDSLVEPATAGLNDAGPDAAKDIDILVHCNFPYPAPSHLPVRRIGFDVRTMLSASIDWIAHTRNGRKIPPVTNLPVLFEHEVKTAF